MIKFYASRRLSITIGILEKMIAKWKWGGHAPNEETHRRKSEARKKKACEPNNLIYRLTFGW